MLRVVVPARVGSTRCPEKMLQLIGKKTLIRHSVERILEGAAGFEVVVATDDARVIEEVGEICDFVLTSDTCRSGTDRVAEALQILDPGGAGVAVNIQADMPFLDPGTIRGFLAAAGKPGPWEMLTALCDHHIVKVRLDGFERDAVPCHVGLYAYTRDALRIFAELPTSDLEAGLGLEQIRSVEAGFRISFHAVGMMPFEVNTPADLAAAQHLARCLA